MHVPCDVYIPYVYSEERYTMDTITMTFPDGGTQDMDPDLYREYILDCLEEGIPQ